MMNDINERLILSQVRIAEIKNDTMPNPRYCDFFVIAAEYIEFVLDVREKLGKDGVYSGELELEELNEKLFFGLSEDYGDGFIIDAPYFNSFANPDHADIVFGTFTPYICFLTAELHNLPQLIYDGKDEAVTILLELFLEIYNLFLMDASPLLKSVRDAVYFYAFDYAEYFLMDRTKEMFVPETGLIYDIVMNADLSDTSYLYRYGENISYSELELAEFMNTLSDEEIESMASTFTQGMRRGFTSMNVDFDSRETVSIRFFIGQERLVRAAVKQFKDMGLKAILSRYAVGRVVRHGITKQGCENLSAFRQFEYDHRMDDSLFLDRKYMERKISAARAAYEEYADYMSVYGGPAVIEIFGEEDFEPVSKDTACKYTDEQKKLSTELTSSMGLLREEYLPGDSYSFTIISFPVPDIGDDFNEIFRDTVKINTLPNDTYVGLQQTIIDTFDRASYVKVEGTHGNKTDMKVIMRRLENPDEETQFENCVADVNIPLGEVFTSPVLKGTGGTLHVSSVYINGLQFKDLIMTFKDGMVESYTCSNFDEEEKNKGFIDDNILFNHSTLPLGEFAIGTNTYAYEMGRKYDIMRKLPILIIEKTGPHFAVGDTCYSHAEDTKVYNPNGKEIISRENDFSLLRDTEPEKAYFNCHTDITIPFDELGRLYAVNEDGTEVDIIRDGRFVLPGTEGLNEGFNS